MFFVYEALIVGIWSFINYLLVRTIFPKISYIYVLIIVGLLKHMLSGIIGLLKTYCKFGNACKMYNYSEDNRAYLLLDSILEVFYFLILGTILYPIRAMNEGIIFFIIGFILHITFELLGLHIYFCETRCVY